MARYVQVIAHQIHNRILWDGVGDPPLVGLVLESAAAGVPDYAAVAVVVVPEIALPHLFRRALAEAGMLAGIQQYIDGLDSDSALKIDWEFAPSLRRNAKGIKAAQTDIGLSDAQLDALWIRAEELGAEV